MAIQDTDLLLINRAGASYKVAAADLVDKVQAGDLALVNRSGDSYKLAGDKLTAGTFNDSDLFLINRAGASYQVAGSEVKAILNTPPPFPDSAAWAFAGKNSNGSSFRLTITFIAGKKINLNKPTLVPLKLSCQRDSFYASLTSPITKLGGPVYETEYWINLSTATEQDISPDFTSIDDGQKMSFDIFVPNTVDIGGITQSAITSPINGLWTGTFGVFQNGLGYRSSFQQFSGDNDYFN